MLALAAAFLVADCDKAPAPPATTDQVATDAAARKAVADTDAALREARGGSPPAPADPGTK